MALQIEDASHRNRHITHYIVVSGDVHFESESRRLIAAALVERPKKGEKK
jgi:hypothetical protein